MNATITTPVPALTTTIPIVDVETTALQAFFGAGEAKRKARAAALIGPGYRPQEIYTPACIRDALLQVWPHIALDPCSGPNSIMEAHETFYVPPTVIVSKTGRKRVVYVPGEGDTDGLAQPWQHYTFVNPPYGNLKKWMDKISWEGSPRGERREVAALVPWRGHRAWFRDAIATCTSIVDLDPLAFVGFKNTFPAPLVMLYWGESKSLFELAFEALGDAR